jgi:rhodanese-related sulfurtransferase
MIKKIIVSLALIQSALMAEFKEVSVNELEDMMKKNIPIIDIRTPGEWKETGVIKGSHKIMFFDERGGYNVEKWLNEFSKYVKDKDQPFVLVCRTASRTKMVGKFLDAQMGYKHVNDLKGGIMKWMRSNKEVVK